MGNVAGKEKLMTINEFKNKIENEEIGLFALITKIRNEEPDVPITLADAQIILNHIDIIEFENFVSIEISFRNMDEEQVKEVLKKDYEDKRSIMDAKQVKEIYALHDLYDKYISVISKIDYTAEFANLSTNITCINDYHGEILMCNSPIFWGTDDRNRIFKILFDKKMCAVINSEGEKAE